MLDIQILQAEAMRRLGTSDFCVYANTMTYIAKDADSDVYKIGRSSNLRQRILTIRNSHYFGRRNFQLIAFEPSNIEGLVQSAIINAGVVPIGYEKRKGKSGAQRKEMFSLSPREIDVVIMAFRFHRTKGNKIPISIARDEDGFEGYTFKYSVTQWADSPQRRK